MATKTDFKKVLKKSIFNKNIERITSVYDGVIKQYFELYNVPKSAIWQELINKINKGARPTLLLVTVVGDKLKAGGNTQAPAELKQPTFNELRKIAKAKGYELSKKTTKKQLVEWLSTQEEE